MNRSALVLNTSQIKTRRVVFLYQSPPFLSFILSPSYDASLCCAAPSTRSVIQFGFAASSYLHRTPREGMNQSSHCIARCSAPRARGGLGTNIVLTTTEKFDAEFLKKNEAIWKPALQFTRAMRDTTWHKVVIHGIPTAIFNDGKGMSLLEEEIKVYNGLSLISKPKWLSSSENRAKNRFASAIIAFETEKEAEKALRNRLQIAGISVKTAKL